MTTWTYDSTNEANLMKIKYGKLIEKQFNMENVLFGRIKKMDDFVGTSITRPVIQSIGGGVGAGALPSASVNKIGKATLSTTKQYAVTSIDRESMKAAKTDEGAYVRATKFPVKIVTKSFNRNLERQITKGDASGSGVLFTGNATNADVTGLGTSASPFLVYFDVSAPDASDYAQIEEGDLLNVNAEETDLEVVAIDEANDKISLVGTSARLTALVAAPSGFVAADELYMQESKDNELIGLEGVLLATSGSYKGITIGRRWQSYINSTAGAISTDLMNDVVINIKRKCGESPDMIVTSYKQYIKFLNLLEDQKTYNLPARDKNFKAAVSFSGIEYISPDGVIPVFPSRFVADAHMMFLNSTHIELHNRPGGFEWFDEDGTVFLRESGDSYEARYGGYCDLFINPHFQGILSALT